MKTNCSTDCKEKWEANKAGRERTNQNQSEQKIADKMEPKPKKQCKYMEHNWTHEDSRMTA